MLYEIFINGSQTRSFIVRAESFSGAVAEIERLANESLVVIHGIQYASLDELRIVRVESEAVIEAQGGS